MSRLAVPDLHIPEDPVNLRVYAGKGEPKQFALISKDGQFQVYAEAIPFPMEVSDGPCRLSVLMTTENYYGVFIQAAGFKPLEDLVSVTQSNDEKGQSNGKATDAGTYNSALFPDVRGKRSGKVRFNISAKSCSLDIEFPWGEGSYELQ